MLKVSELAKRAGVTPDTVRFYTRQGLLSPQRDPDNSYQIYREHDYQRLVFAKKARQLGFSLKEITDILGEADEAHSPCPLVRELFEQKFAQVEQQIRELTALRNRMAEAMSAWQAMPNATPDGHTICRLIEHWNDADSCASCESQESAGGTHHE